MYTEIQLSYGPVMFADLKNFYLLIKQTTTGADSEKIYSYFIVGIYSGREYDVEENVYYSLKEKFDQMVQDELNREIRLSNALLGQAGKEKKVGRPSKDAKD